MGEGGTSEEQRLFPVKKKNQVGSEKKSDLNYQRTQKSSKDTNPKKGGFSTIMRGVLSFNGRGKRWKRQIVARIADIKVIYDRWRKILQRDRRPNNKNEVEAARTGEETRR